MRDSNKEIFKSTKPTGSDEANMELRPSQLVALNLILPSRYKFEFTDQKNFRTVSFN
jgi:hypothetical protein